MSAPKISRKKADIVSACAFVALFFIFGALRLWWPWMLLAVGGALTLRQYLRGRPYDIFLTAAIFVGLFLNFLFNMRWNVLMPVLLVLGAIYLFYREYVCYRERVGSEEIEDMKSEIDDRSGK